MKKSALFLALVGLAHFALMAQKKSIDSYTITVDVSSIKPSPKRVYLNYFISVHGGMETCLDSAAVKNGRAFFKGSIAEPTPAFLHTKMFDVNGRFILAKGNIRIKTGSAGTGLTVTGSTLESDFERMMKKQDEYSMKLAELSGQYEKAVKDKKADTALMIDKKRINLNKEMYQDIFRSYIQNHAKTSALSVYALREYNSAGFTGIDTLFNLLLPAFKKFPTAVIIKKKIDLDNSLAIGKIAMDFIQPDTLGHMVSLSSFRGKYVLVDFWASWCHPCRAESPYMLKAYQKYHSKNFEILGISLDSKKTQIAWMGAIHTDKTSVWAQVSDLKGWKNAASTTYGVTAIPQNYLLNPDGQIIAKDLRGDELEKKLQEILK